MKLVGVPQCMTSFTAMSCCSKSVQVALTLREEKPKRVFWPRKQHWKQPRRKLILWYFALPWYMRHQYCLIFPLKNKDIMLSVISVSWTRMSSKDLVCDTLRPRTLQNAQQPPKARTQYEAVKTHHGTSLINGTKCSWVNEKIHQIHFDTADCYCIF